MPAHTCQSCLLQRRKCPSSWPRWLLRLAPRRTCWSCLAQRRSCLSLWLGSQLCLVSSRPRCQLGLALSWPRYQLRLVPESLAPAVLAAAADPSAVVAEVSVASGVGARVSVVSAVPELSVVAADVSEVSVGAMPSDDAVAAASLGVESVVIAEPSETGGGGSSPRAGAVNRDAQSTAANTATVQPTNPRPRLRSKRGGRIPETAAELPSISASSPWLRPLSELRVSHLTARTVGFSFISCLPLSHACVVSVRSRLLIIRTLT